MSTIIATSAIKAEADVVAVRQRAKRVAALVGFDLQDQTRIATAVSEIARNAFGYAGGGTAEFAVEEVGREQALMVTISDAGGGIAALTDVLDGRYVSPTGMGLGLIGARRLMDRFEVDSAPGRGTTVRLGKTLPRGSRISGDTLASAAAAIRSEIGPDPFEILREQNRELLESFAELRARQDELQRLNRELEDTNRGIVALYSELDQRAEQLRVASELKSRFLSYVSHEFRTPLNSIMGLSRLLLDRLDGPLTGEQERQVIYIRQSAESLTELVNDLLDLAKVEAGRVEVRIAPFAVADLFAALRGALKPLLGNRAVELTMDVPADFPRLETDEGKLAQILRNLISNALKYTDEGSVRVDALHEPRRGRIVFRVADTGIGIAPEDLPKIFEEFGQVDGPLQRRQKGTGLGLPLSRKLAELLGGAIEVESTPGRGSVFRLVLPDSIAVRAGDQPVAGFHGLRTLLVVDDEAPFRYLVRQMLKDAAPVVVIDAEDGEEALIRLKETVPDAVILDLNMPKRDGFGVYEAMLRDRSLDGVPVLVATSAPLTPAIRSRLPGVAGFLPKHALARDTLLDLLRQIADKRDRR